VFGALARTLIPIRDLKEIFFYKENVRWQIIYSNFLGKHAKTLIKNLRIVATALAKVWELSDKYGYYLFLALMGD